MPLCKFCNHPIDDFELCIDCASELYDEDSESGQCGGEEDDEK